MKGDKLVVTSYHRDGAARVMEALRPRLAADAPPLAVTISGESGSGKTEIAHCLAELLDAEGRSSVVLAQDDYFRLPPKTNHNKRLGDIGWVGTGEVRLDLLDEHVAALKAGLGAPLEKPLVDFDTDSIGSETLEPGRRDVVIAEGTYTARLDHADVRVFIDRHYLQTKKARLTRGRDPDVDFLERVLAIEHELISVQAELADVVLPPPEDERGIAPPGRPPTGRP